MWESRVLGEISKALWKPFWGFHRAGISIAEIRLFDVRPAIVSRSNDEDASGATIGSRGGELTPPWMGPIIAGPPRTDGA